MSRNRRKTALNVAYNLSDPIVHGEVTGHITAHLTKLDERDRAVFLNLTTEDAQYLAHRLLFHVKAIEDAREARESYLSSVRVAAADCMRRSE